MGITFKRMSRLEIDEQSFQQRQIRFMAFTSLICLSEKKGLFWLPERLHQMNNNFWPKSVEKAYFFNVWLVPISPSNIGIFMTASVITGQCILFLKIAPILQYRSSVFSAYRQEHRSIIPQRNQNS